MQGQHYPPEPSFAQQIGVLGMWWCSRAVGRACTRLDQDHLT
jgi:hypothetical protein